MIVISEDVWSEDFALLKERFPILHEPDLWNRRDDLKKALSKAEALVVRNRTQVNQELFDAAPNLKIVARAGVGLDNIDVNSANEHGVVVSAALGVNARAVGELTLGLALALLRSIPERDASTREGNWNRGAGREVSGKTWGMLGFGATARATAELLSGFGNPVIAYDPFVKSSPLASMKDLDSLIRESDILSIHLPATAETTNLIDAKRLSQMKKSAILINVGRGEVVNEVDLEAALRTGVIAGAALDVRAKEPPQDQRFTDLPNVILTPHIAGITHESQSAINKVLVAEIEAALTGQPQRYAVGTIKQARR